MCISVWEQNLRKTIWCLPKFVPWANLYKLHLSPLEKKCWEEKLKLQCSHWNLCEVLGLYRASLWFLVIVGHKGVFSVRRLASSHGHWPLSFWPSPRSSILHTCWTPTPKTGQVAVNLACSQWTHVCALLGEFQIYLVRLWREEQKVT